ncbi:MAG: hypothetical protein KAX49_04300 [Halanaerobiales bacterium]|nr:hypothetical protein [Halanaerobiales bacterium]
MKNLDVVAIGAVGIDTNIYLNGRDIDFSVEAKMLAKTNLIHVNIVNWTRYLLPLAKEMGIKIACDIQDIVELGDEYRKDFIENADILFFSSVNFDEPVPLIKKFIEISPAEIVISGMGAKGCAVGFLTSYLMYFVIFLGKSKFWEMLICRT